MGGGASTLRCFHLNRVLLATFLVPDEIYQDCKSATLKPRGQIVCSLL